MNKYIKYSLIIIIGIPVLIGLMIVATAVIGSLLAFMVFSSIDLASWFFNTLIL